MREGFIDTQPVCELASCLGYCSLLLGFSTTGFYDYSEILMWFNILLLTPPLAIHELGYFCLKLEN